MTSSVIYYSTDARKNEIYLLINEGNLCTTLQNYSYDNLVDPKLTPNILDDLTFLEI